MDEEGFYQRALDKVFRNYVRENDVEGMAIALTLGADLNYQDDMGLTHLGFASMIGREDAVDFLLVAEDAYDEYKEKFYGLEEPCSCIDTPDINGKTPLILASEMGYQNIVAKLRKNGANIESRDSNGRTALIGAADYNQYKAGEDLVVRGRAEVNVMDLDGMTPLMWASYWGNVAFMDLLVRYGAKFDLKSKDGLTALDCAEQNQQEKAVKYLKSIMERQK